MATATARLPVAVLVVWLLAAALAGCGGSGEGGLPPCDAPERQGRAVRVAPMPHSVRDSIVQAFAGQNRRVRRVILRQEACRFRASVRVDSFTTAAYATNRGFSLIRTLKTNAVGETRPLSEDPLSDMGTGLYDYVVEFERAGDHSAAAPRESQATPWVRLSKPYHNRYVTVRR